MLLERGMAREALAAFEATLKKEPRRLGATIGAARAAARSGDAAKAREVLRGGRCARRECRPGQAGNRRGADVHGEQVGFVGGNVNATNRTLAFVVAAALGLGGVAEPSSCWHAVRATARPARSGAEMPWPFPMDQWGRGKAFPVQAR